MEPKPDNSPPKQDPQPATQEKAESSLMDRLRDPSTRAKAAAFWKRGGTPVMIVLGLLAGLIFAYSIPEGTLVRKAPQQDEAAKADPNDPHASHQHEEGAMDEFWACPMFCTRMDGPGDCPVCGMTLEKFVDSGAALPLNEKQRRAMGIKSTTVQRRKLAREIRSYGVFKADETVQKVVSAWIGGRIERMYADYTGVEVQEGWHLFDIYSPELYSAQEELLIAIKALEDTPKDGPLRKSREAMKSVAVEKLALLGLSTKQIEEIEKSKVSQLTLRIDSPASGVVLEKLGHPGMYIQKGQPIYRIADLSSLWLILDVHESDLAWIALGQEVEITTDGLGAKQTTGRVGFIEPTLNAKTRTARVRVEVPNPDGKLRLGMFATASILAEMTQEAALAAPALSGDFACPMHPLQRGESAEADCPICGMKLTPSPEQSGGKGGALLAIPREAVISTGTRHLVYVETLFGDLTEVDGERKFIPGDGSYSAFEVKLGPLAYEWVTHANGHRQRKGAYYPLLGGQVANPEAGDLKLIPSISRVVLNGQFLIDSQMELTGKPSLINAEGGAAADPHADHR